MTDHNDNDDNTDGLTPNESLMIRRTRHGQDDIMGMAGAAPASITMDRLGEARSIADTALAQFSIGDETLYQTAERLQIAGRRANGAGWKAAQHAIAAHQTYDAEQAEFTKEFSKRDQIAPEKAMDDLEHAYTTAMQGEVTRVCRKFKCSPGEAKKLIDERIAVRGMASVLPTYARILARAEAKMAAGTFGQRKGADPRTAIGIKAITR